MKNQYFGDVGDFGKYGMIRYFVNTIPELRIGINWYLTENDVRTDGKHIDYLLKSTQLRECDPCLYDFLRKCIINDSRAISEIEESGLLANTLFFSDILDYSGLGHPQDRAKFRESWFENSIRLLRGAKLIYVDPDNGLEVKSQSIYGSNGVKYISYDEIKRYYEHGFSLIVYNHRDRKPQQQYINRFRPIRNFVNAELICLRFFRYSVRDYVFVLHHDITEKVTYALEKFVKGLWGECFQFYQIEL